MHSSVAEASCKQIRAESEILTPGRVNRPRECVQMGSCPARHPNTLIGHICGKGMPQYPVGVPFWTFPWILGMPF